MTRKQQREELIDVVFDLFVLPAVIVLGSYQVYRWAQSKPEDKSRGRI